MHSYWWEYLSFLDIYTARVTAGHFLFPYGLYNPVWPLDVRLLYRPPEYTQPIVFPVNQFLTIKSEVFTFLECGPRGRWNADVSPSSAFSFCTFGHPCPSHLHYRTGAGWVSSPSLCAGSFYASFWRCQGVMTLRPGKVRTLRPETFYFCHFQKRNKTRLETYLCVKYQLRIRDGWTSVVQVHEFLGRS